MSEPSRAAPTPIFLEGGEIGVLLIHGFTSSPSDMGPLGHYLHQHGLTVSVPLLPGHGTTPEDLNRQRRQDWIDHVEGAWHLLADRCTRVFAAGLSLGALLAITLAARQPAVTGLILYSPALIVMDPRSHVVALLKYLTPTVSRPPVHFVEPSAHAHLWAYPVYPTAASHEVMRLTGDAKRALPMVRCPVLTMYSTADTSIHPNCAAMIDERVGTTDSSIITLQKSGHVITLDCEWEQLAQQSLEFIQQRAGVTL